MMAPSGCGMSKRSSPVGQPWEHGERVNSVAFSPDGNRIVSGGNEGDNTGSVRLWDANTGQLVSATTIGEAQRIVWAVTFSPDGHRVAAAGVDGFIQVLDAGTGSTPSVSRLRGHEDRVVSSGVTARTAARSLPRVATKPSGYGTSSPASR